MKFRNFLIVILAGQCNPSNALPRADCAWEVREIIPTSGTITTLAQAEALAANPGDSTVLVYQSDVINRNDPKSPGNGGFFQGDLPFAADNLTPSGRVSENDDDFVLHARCAIVVTEENDYTFGFSSDEGARLRIEGSTFLSSTRINPDNPANPAHQGNTLSYAITTTNSDTLGVCHLTPGTYEIDFLTWERSGGAYAEVFAAAGARIAIDEAFRLIGHRASGLVGDNSRIATPGWKVWVLRDNAESLGDALTQIYETWSAGTTVTGLRFTSAIDFPDRDPVTFLLEGSHNGAATGPWMSIASGVTGLPTARGAAAPVVQFPNAAIPVVSYRLTFPGIRNAATADSVQIGEVQFLDASGNDLSVPGDAVSPTSANSPPDGLAPLAIDNNTGSSYRNFDKLNAGFTVTPHSRSYQTINFHDPQRGGGGHGFPQVAFPGDTATDDNYFAIGARSTLTITTPGEYTFCLLTDDSARFRIKQSIGWTVSSPNPAVTAPQLLVDGMQLNGCCGDVFGTVHLDVGNYEVELISHEGTGGAYVGLWSAFGRHTAFNPVHFSLMGSNTRNAGNDTVPFSLLAPSDLSPPKNDDFANSFSIPGNAAHVAGCNMGATLEDNEPRQLQWQKTLWWNWTATATGIVQVDTAGSEIDTVLAVYAGSTVDGLILVAANDDEPPFQTSKLIFVASAGVTYRFQAGGFGGESGRILLNLGPPPPPVQPPPNDDFASATSLGSATSLSIAGTTAGATSEISEPDHWLSNPANAGASVWFTWSAPYPGEFILDTRGSRFDTVLAVYTGTSVGQLTLVAADDQGPSVGDQSRLSFKAASGILYRIALDGYTVSKSGSYVLNLIPVPIALAPSVIASGQSRIFNLKWRSEPFITYQIQQSANLNAWTPMTSCLPSKGTETDFGIPAGSARMFFRVLRE